MGKCRNFSYYLSYFQKMMILSGIVLKNVGRWETKNPFPKVMSRNKCERNTKAQYTCTTEAPGKLNKRNLWCILCLLSAVTMFLYTHTNTHTHTHTHTQTDIHRNRKKSASLLSKHTECIWKYTLITMRFLYYNIPGIFFAFLHLSLVESLLVPLKKKKKIVVHCYVL